MKNQKGVLHLAVPLLLVVIIGAAVYLMVTLGVIKNPFQNFSLTGKKEAKVTLKSEYKNPFKKDTQYVNPFDSYKNPFVVAK